MGPDNVPPHEEGCDPELQNYFEHAVVELVAKEDHVWGR